MRKHWKVLALILAICMMGTLFTACGGGNDSGTSETGQDSTQSGTQETGSGTANDSTAVTIGYVGSHQSSYPSSSISNDFITQKMIYDKLFEVDDDTNEYTSRVLNSWEWVDGVTLKLVLKDGIYFSDGNQMTGEDVLFSLQNYMNNGTSTDKYPYYQFIDFDQSYVDTDGMTVYVVYTQEYGPALNTLDCCIMEKAFTEAHDESDEVWFTGPVGSGPYVVSDCSIDSYVTYALRDDYWNKDYSYDVTELTLKFYTDETAMYVDYQNGLLDVAYGISANVCDQIEAAGDQGTVKYVSNNDVSLLVLNDNNQYLSDPAVREAIAYGLDMDAISNIAYGVLCTSAKSHFASTFDAYSEHEGYNYDPDYAKQVLADAGYSDGEIVLDFVAVNFDPQPQIAEAVQGYLSAIGITVNVNSYDLGTALGIYMEGKSDLNVMTVNGGNPTREPHQALSAIMDTASFICMAIDDSTFNGYIYTGLNTVDSDTRTEAYQAADTWLYDNYLALPICETLSAYAYNDRIATFNQSSVGKSCIGNIVLN